MKSILAVLCLVGVLLAATDAQRFRVRRQAPADEEVAMEDLSRESDAKESREVEEAEPGMMQDCINDKGNNHKSCGTWWWEWSQWTSCSKSCGGGTRYREADRWCNCKTWAHGNQLCKNIPKAEEAEGCEQWCVNGHYDTIRDQCVCNDNFYGFCCEIPRGASADVIKALRHAQDELALKRPAPKAPAPEVHAAAPGPQAPASGHGSSAGVIAAGCIVALVALVAATAIIAVVVKKRKATTATDKDTSTSNPAYVVEG